MEAPLETWEWLYLRCGRFTASENFKLFTGGRRAMTEEELKVEKKAGGTRKTVDTIFGDTAMGYILQKAAERLTLQVKEESNFVQTTWGKEQEWLAKEMYESRTGYSGDYFGVTNPKFFEYGEYAGFSPDWLSLTDTERRGADFKCPYNSSEHIINLLLKDQGDLKNKRWEYYIQIQTTMFMANLDKFDFVSYDGRFIEQKYKMKVLTVLPDKTIHNEYSIRLEAAVSEMNKIIDSLK
jgi:hypothetical protein